MQHTLLQDYLTDAQGIANPTRQAVLSVVISLAAVMTQPKGEIPTLGGHVSPPFIFGFQTAVHNEHDMEHGCLGATSLIYYFG